MNKKIERMVEEIERRGGVVGINTALPDEVAEAFLEQILDCPDCREAAETRTRASARSKPNEH